MRNNLTNIIISNNKQLLEDNRRELIQKSKRGREEKDGQTRYEKRKRVRVSSSVASYNRINMNELFKRDTLIIGVNVVGETDNYVVTIKFYKVLDAIKKQLQQNNDKIEFKVIYKALASIFNSGDVYIECTCDDYKFRLAYWNSRSNINAGKPETRPSNITNPTNDLGPACKHISAVLANINWLMKVASVIVNYIKFMAEHQERKFADIIYPAIFGRKYDKEVQLNLFDFDNRLSTSRKVLNVANRIGRDRGKFKNREPENR